MSGPSTNKTYHIQQFSRENEKDNNGNVVEFRPSDPIDFADNPQRVWISTTDDSLKWTTDGVTINEFVDSADLAALQAEIDAVEVDVAGLHTQVNGIQVELDAFEAEYANFTNASTGVAQQAIINGGFSVNQRVKTGSVVLTAGQYGHDRWKGGASGCTYTFSTSLNVTTLTITAGSLVQVVEGGNLTSGTYTLSWTGTAQGKIGAGAFSASGVTGTSTGGTDLSIEFNTGTLSRVQFNKGTVALPFQQKSFAYELQACQRYYEKSYDYSIAPATSSNSLGIESKVVSNNTIPANSFYGKVSYRTQKRTSTPTVTIRPLVTPTNTGRVTTSAGVDLGASSGSLLFQSSTGFTVYNGSGGSLVTTDTGVIFHWESEAEL